VRFDVIAYDGIDELDALGPLEVLRNAGRAGAGVEAHLVTRDGARTVTGGHGMRIVVDGLFTPGADVVVVPGGGWATRSSAGAWGEVERGDWLPLLDAAAAGGAVMASVCTGALLLAHAGVIGSRRAATHHAARRDLAATGAEVVTERVVDVGDVITSGGVTSGIDLGLWLVERFVGPTVADAVADEMEYERYRPRPVT
jgi:transcriptional regulator GlxA family with amidase domain